LYPELSSAEGKGLSEAVPCESVGVVVRFGDVTCYADGTVTAQGPAVIWLPAAQRSLDGRSRRVGRVQQAILKAVEAGAHTREEVIKATGLPKGTVWVALASLVRKGLLKVITATPGGPCRSYYLAPGQSPDELIRGLGLRPCRQGRRRKSAGQGTAVGAGAEG
jgi:hypothetical protein